MTEPPHRPTVGELPQDEPPALHDLPRAAVTPAWCAVGRGRWDDAMGMTAGFVEFLLECRSAAGGLGDVLTLGRQQALLSKHQARSVARRHRLTIDDPTRFGPPHAADVLLREWLGAMSVTSLDRSDFEGATLIHDLNEPLDPRFDQGYDTVIDGGTLEHVFNLPVALSSAMRLVRVGGMLAIFTPANNLCGHGFYQFSPELFFRVLAPENGYRVERMILLSHPYPSVELGSGQRWYEVVDPARLGTRTLLQSSRPATLMIAARRERAVQPLAAMPQQSDYASRWAGAAGPRNYAPAGGMRLRCTARSAALALVNRLMGWSLVRGQLERRAAALRDRPGLRRVR